MFRETGLMKEIYVFPLENFNPLNYRILEEKVININYIKNILEPDKMYWFRRLGRKRVYMTVTENVPSFPYSGLE